VPPIPIDRRRRGACSVSRFSALWRTFVLLDFAFTAAGTVPLMLVALGVGG
jgi:hypothetical protein